MWFINEYFNIQFPFIFIVLKTEKIQQLFKSLLEIQLDYSADTQLVTFRGDLPYTSEDIIKRIELLDDTDIIGSGGFGTVYKLVMDNNSLFAVKKIVKCGVASNRIFEIELEILGSIKHRNLVNLQGYCKFPTSKCLSMISYWWEA